MNAHQRSRRNHRIRQILLRTVVWIVLAVFILTSVGVALVNFTAH
jgi:hypothetical protein